MCPCPRETPESRPGRNIICVSGPDGFIDAYAGTKHWLGGKEIQGPVGGILNMLKVQSNGRMADWLVLKM